VGETRGGKKFGVLEGSVKRWYIIIKLHQDDAQCHCVELEL